MNDFRERIEEYNGELVQVKIHLNFALQLNYNGTIVQYNVYVLDSKRKGY